MKNFLFLTLQMFLLSSSFIQKVECVPQALKVHSLEFINIVLFASDFFFNERSRMFLIDELFVRRLLSLPRGRCGGFGELPVVGCMVFDGWGDDWLVLQEPTFVQMTFLPLVWVAQLCLTLCDPTDCSPPGSSVHGILLARILEWVAMPSSRGSSRPRDWTRVSRIAGGFFTIWATKEAQILLHHGLLKSAGCQDAQLIIISWHMDYKPCSLPTQSHAVFIFDYDFMEWQRQPW